MRVFPNASESITYTSEGIIYLITSSYQGQFVLIQNFLLLKILFWNNKWLLVSCCHQIKLIIWTTAGKIYQHLSLFSHVIQLKSPINHLKLSCLAYPEKTCYFCGENLSAHVLNWFVLLYFFLSFQCIWNCFHSYWCCYWTGGEWLAFSKEAPDPAEVRSPVNKVK